MAPVTLTDAARVRMTTILDSQSKSTLTLTVTSKGCGGHGYAFHLGDCDGDVVDLGEGKRLIIDRNSILWLVGTEIDYVEDGLGSNFRFSNPLAAHQCACGKSFTC